MVDFSAPDSARLEPCARTRERDRRKRDQLHIAAAAAPWRRACQSTGTRPGEPRSMNTCSAVKTVLVKPETNGMIKQWETRESL